MTEKEQHVYSPLGNYEKAAFQLALYEIALEEADKSMTEGDENEAFEKMCLDSMPRMMKVIDKYVRKVSYIRFVRNTLPKVGRAVAAVILLALLGSTIAIASSKTIRASVIEFLIRTTPEYTAVGFYQTGDSIDIPENWGADYYPLYIPDGFSVDKVSTGQWTSEVLYINGNGDGINVLFGSIATQSRFDSEDAEIVHIEINGVDSLLILKDNSNKIIGQLGDDYYCISTTLPLDEVIRIAKSITLIVR